MNNTPAIDDHHPLPTSTRYSRRHPYKFRCTLHTKKWTKSRVNHYAKIFLEAAHLKNGTQKIKTKTSFLRGVINLFA